MFLEYKNAMCLTVICILIFYNDDTLKSTLYLSGPSVETFCIEKHIYGRHLTWKYL